MPFNDNINGRESRLAKPEVGQGRGRPTHDKSISGADHGWETTNTDANLIGAASDEDGGDKGMKRKKIRRQVDGVVQRGEERIKSNGPDEDDVTVQHVDDEVRKTEKEFHRPGRKIRRTVTTMKVSSLSNDAK